MFPSRFADFPWKTLCGVIIVLGLVFLRRWLIRRICRIVDEMTPDSRRRIFKEKGLGRISKKKTQSSPCRITEEDSPTVSLPDNTCNSHIMLYEIMRWNRPRRIIEETSSLTHPESSGVTSQSELLGIPEVSPANMLRPLQMEAPCAHCQRSGVILRERLNVKAGHSKLGGVGPSFHLTCTVGDSRLPIKFLIDTGCTSSAIDLRLVKRLGLLDKVDRSNHIWYEAMGGQKKRTHGTISVPVKTKSGFSITESLIVAEMTLSSPLIGLEVLAANNCSILLDVDLPWLLVRRRDQCPSLKDLRFRDSADVMAKFNGQQHKCTLDTGSIKTVIPKYFDFQQVPLSASAYFNVAAEKPLRISRKVTDVEVEVDECVGRVTPLVLTEDRPMIGTDFLHSKRIDFFHGRAYVKPLVWATKGPTHRYRF